MQFAPPLIPPPEPSVARWKKLEAHRPTLGVIVTSALSVASLPQHVLISAPMNQIR